MKIPVNDKTGYPTVSVSQLRTYGVSGLRVDQQEDSRGCPRLYHAKYVEKSIPDSHEPSYELEYGSYFHRVMFRLERDEITPEQALLEEFPATLPPEAMAEAKHDLEEYLARGATPSDRFAAVSMEAELSAELYVDEEFGPIWFRGFIDWIGVDTEVMNVVHFVDYKTNRSPASVSQINGDIQMKAYHWLVRENAHRWGVDNPRIVAHLDLVKYRDVEVAFTEQDIEDWHDWAVAIVRQILRDNEAKPIINPGCSYCPIRDSCPAFQALPQQALKSAGLPGDEATDIERLKWRDEANKTRLLLEKSVKSIDNDFKDRALRDGVVEVGDERWIREPSWSNVIDLRELHRQLGDEFYEVVNTSKSQLTKLARGRDANAQTMILGCVDSVPDGVKAVRRKVKE